MDNKRNYVVNVEVPISPFHFEYRLKGAHYIHIVREVLRLMRKEPRLRKQQISPFSIKVTLLGSVKIEPEKTADKPAKTEKVDLKKAQEAVDKSTVVLAYPKPSKK